MTQADTQSFTNPVSSRPNARQVFRSIVRKIGLLLKPPFDPTHLSANLRRDAGLDDTGLERRKVARAPLIR